MKHLKFIMGLACAAMFAQPAVAQPVTKTDVGYLVGNPRAPHRLVVVSSYGCPHCRIFDEQALPNLLRSWVATGKVGVEVVPFMMFPTDIAPTLIADCGTTSGFLARQTALFAQQRNMQIRWTNFDQAAARRAESTGGVQGALPMGEALGLVSNSARMGLSQSQARNCLSDARMRRAANERNQRIEARFNVQGTPAIFLNGRPLNTGSSWPRLEAALRQIVR